MKITLSILGIAILIRLVLRWCRAASNDPIIVAQRELDAELKEFYKECDRELRG